MRRRTAVAAIVAGCILLAVGTTATVLALVPRDSAGQVQDVAPIVGDTPATGTPAPTPSPGPTSTSPSTVTPEPPHDVGDDHGGDRGGNGGSGGGSGGSGGGSGKGSGGSDD